MRASILTAVLNDKDHIQECIHSVAEQSFSDIVHINVDGGSTDGTADLLKKAGSPAMRWFSEPDQGIYDALNKGISLATGEVIGLLHSDDRFYSRQTVEQVMFHFIGRNCDAVYGDLLYVSRQDASRVIRYWKSCPFAPALLKSGWMPPHPTLFIKREWYAQTGGYRMGFRISADYDLILRLFKNPLFKPAYLPQIITTMRLGGASNRSLKNICQKSYEDYRALRANGVGGLRSLLLKNMLKALQFAQRKIN